MPGGNPTPRGGFLAFTRGPDKEVANMRQCPQPQNSRNNAHERTPLHLTQPGLGPHHPATRRPIPRKRDTAAKPALQKPGADAPGHHLPHPRGTLFPGTAVKPGLLAMVTHSKLGRTEVREQGGPKERSGVGKRPQVASHSDHYQNQTQGRRDATILRRTGTAGTQAFIPKPESTSCYKTVQWPPPLTPVLRKDSVPKGRAHTSAWSYAREDASWRC